MLARSVSYTHLDVYKRQRYQYRPQGWVEDLYTGQANERALAFLNRFQGMVYLDVYKRQGSIFRVPFVYVPDLAPVLEQMHAKGIHTYAAHLKEMCIRDRIRPMPWIRQSRVSTRSPR